MVYGERKGSECGTYWKTRSHLVIEIPFVCGNAHELENWRYLKVTSSRLDWNSSNRLFTFCTKMLWLVWCPLCITTPRWAWGNNVLHRRLMVSWDALGRVLPANQGRWSFPSPHHWWDLTLCTVSSSWPSITKETRHAGKSNNGLQRWWRDWSTFLVREGSELGLLSMEKVQGELHQYV